MFDTVGDGDADGQDDGDDDDDDDDDGDDYSMVSSGIQNKHGLPSGPLQQQFEVVFWPEVPWWATDGSCKVTLTDADKGKGKMTMTGGFFLKK